MLIRTPRLLVRDEMGWVVYRKNKNKEKGDQYWGYIQDHKAPCAGGTRHN